MGGRGAGVCCVARCRVGLCLYEMDKVLDGQRGQPGIAEFIGELPAIEWPEEGE